MNAVSEELRKTILELQNFSSVSEDPIFTPSWNRKNDTL